MCNRINNVSIFKESIYSTFKILFCNYRVNESDSFVSVFSKYYVQHDEN